jgi:hypothetical protein
MKASNFINPSVSSLKKYGKSQQLFPENTGRMDNGFSGRRFWKL